MAEVYQVACFVWNEGEVKSWNNWKFQGTRTEKQKIEVRKVEKGSEADTSLYTGQTAFTYQDLSIQFIHLPQT